MRDLNFRVWDKKLKLMRPVNKIDFEQRKITYISHSLYTQIEHMADFIEHVSFDDCEIMQSTGYKDNNGTEILEGDILNLITDTNIDYISTVYWDKRICSLIVDHPEGEYAACVSSTYFSSVKIIGNIYQNPELLEKKE